jgi:hypothetical protein
MIPVQRQGFNLPKIPHDFKALGKSYTLTQSLKELPSKIAEIVCDITHYGLYDLISLWGMSICRLNTVD